MKKNFNKFERSASRLLSRFPKIKRSAKKTYARLVYFLSIRNVKPGTACGVSSIDFPGFESFFGYYDKSPLSSSGYLLCYLSSYSSHKLPSSSEPISVAVFHMDRLTKPILQISTLSYNWQQGARAHWLNDDLFIFNDFDTVNKRYISRVFSISMLQEVKRFDCPVQDSFNSEFFLSVNYRRLMALRPDYGYRNMPPLSKQDLANLDEDGIWKFEYSNSEVQLLYSLTKICALRPRREFQKSLHEVNHILISPSGRKFLFLHRYYTHGRRNDRLILGTRNGEKIKLIADYGMVSHYFWIDEDQVLGYLRNANGEEGYFIININSLKFYKLDSPILNSCGDGHPHVYDDWFVTDTYPNKIRTQKLFYGNWKTGQVKLLGEFFHGFKFDSETRCDLHPRISFNGKVVFFDTVLSGKRQLAWLDLEA